MAKGYVYFSRTDTTTNVDIPDVTHYLLRDRMRVIVSSGAFGFSPFNGKLHEIQILLGPGGFVDGVDAFNAVRT